MGIDFTFNELHHLETLNVEGHLCLMEIDLTFNELHHVETLNV
jgi:hypothetical protein